MLISCTWNATVASFCFMWMCDAASKATGFRLTHLSINLIMEPCYFLYCFPLWTKLFQSKLLDLIDCLSSSRLIIDEYCAWQIVRLILEMGPKLVVPLTWSPSPGVLMNIPDEIAYLLGKRCPGPLWWSCLVDRNNSRKRSNSLSSAVWGTSLYLYYLLSC